MKPPAQWSSLSAKIFRYAVNLAYRYRLESPNHDAEEVTQDVLVWVLETFPSHRDELNAPEVPLYLWSRIDNRVIDIVRRQRRHPEVSLSEANPPVSREEGSGSRIEREDVVEQLRRDLDPKDQFIFDEFMRNIRNDPRTVEERRQAYGIPRGTLHSRIRHIKKVARGFLGDFD